MQVFISLFIFYEEKTVLNIKSINIEKSGNYSHLIASINLPLADVLSKSACKRRSITGLYRCTFLIHRSCPSGVSIDVSLGSMTSSKYFTAVMSSSCFCKELVIYITTLTVTNLSSHL